VVQATLQAGFLTRINNNLNVSICDQFFLGGPLSLRGFKMRGVGPHKDGNALGANVSNGCDTEMLNYLCSQILHCTIVLYWFINPLKFTGYYVYHQI
jgi:outer membrane protein assembly factor BamA